MVKNMNGSFDLADFLQRFSTKVLWHFTGYNKSEIDALVIVKNIIEEKRLRIGKYRSKVIMASGTERYGYPCVCMCDIPFKDLRIHTIRYGKYGLAFNKNKAIVGGHFNPVLYIHKGHFLYKYIEEKIIENIDKLIKLNNELGPKLNEYLYIMGTYLKPSDLTAPITVGNMRIDEEQNNNFYYEREWRSAYDWNFEYEDVEVIMVPKRDIAETNEFLKKNRIENISIITHEMIEEL